MKDKNIAEMPLGTCTKSTAALMLKDRDTADDLDGACITFPCSLVPERGGEHANRDEGKVSCTHDQCEDGLHSSASTDGSGGWDGYDGATSSHGGASPPHAGEHPRAAEEGDGGSVSVHEECAGGATPTSSSTTDDSGSWNGFTVSPTGSPSGSWGDDTWEHSNGGGTASTSVEYPDMNSSRDEGGSWIPQKVGYFCCDDGFESFANDSGTPQDEDVPAQPPCGDMTEALPDVQDETGPRTTAAASGFGASQPSFRLKIMRNISLLQAPPAAEAAGATQGGSGFGQTPESQALKALLGVHPLPLPAATSFGNNHRSHALKRLLGVDPSAAEKPEESAESCFGRTLPSLKLKSLLGVGPLQSGETEEFASAPAASTVVSSPVVTLTAGGDGDGNGDGDGGGGGASVDIRPPPELGSTYPLSPTPALSYLSPGLGPSPPPGFGSSTPPDFGPSTPPGFGPSPPPGFGSSPPPGFGPLAPPGFEPAPPLPVDTSPPIVAPVPSNDRVVACTTCPTGSGSSCDQNPDHQSSVLSKIDSGRFGFMAHLARMGGSVAELGSLRGQGGCAEVYRVSMKDADRQREVDEYTNGSGLVLKIVPKERSFLVEMAMKREIGIVEKFPPRCHANVMDIVSTCKENLCMVMLAAVCDVKTMLSHKQVLSSMSFAERMRMAAGAARGLEYLHSVLDVTHGDVKPENMLVMGDLEIKITDFGLSGYSQEGVVGLTKQYAAPEAVAAFNRPEILEKAKLRPSLDVYSFGIVMIQMLFVEEEPRLGDKALATHGLTPRHASFRTAYNNAMQLHERFEATGEETDQQRLEDASRVMLDLHTDYAAQPARMGNLRETILDEAKWGQPEGLQLRFREEVTLVLLSALHKNPYRRVTLDAVAVLLECPHLWAPAATAFEDDNNNNYHGDNDDSAGLGGTGEVSSALPEDVRAIIEGTIRDGLLADPSLDTGSGVWWKVRQFESPWWEHPPPVEGIVVSRD